MTVDPTLVDMADLVAEPDRSGMANSAWTAEDASTAPEDDPDLFHPDGSAFAGVCKALSEDALPGLEDSCPSAVASTLSPHRL
jgi:hypothetical protein